MSRKPRKTGPVAVPPADSPADPVPDEPLDTESPDDETMEAESETEAPETETNYRQLPPRRTGRGHKHKGESNLGQRISEITDWQDWTLYLYRLSPIIDQTLAGLAIHVTKYTEPIDENRVMHDFGSGGYRIVANRRNEQGLWTTQWRAEFDILNMDYPPKVPPGTWMADPRNAKWAWAKPKEGKEAEAQTSSSPLQLLTAVEAMLDRRDERLRASLQTGTPKDETVLSAVRLGMEQARASAPKEDGTLVKLLADQISTLRAENTGLLNRVLDLLTKPPQAAATTVPKTAAEQLQETAQLLESLDKIRPRRGAVVEEHPAWDFAKSVLAPAVEALAPLAATMLQRTITQPQQPRPASQQHAQQPAPASQRPAATGQPEPKQQEAPLTPGGTITVNRAIPPVLASHFMMALMKLQEGWTGADFAEWLHAGYPDAIPALRMIGSDQDPPMEPAEAIIAIAKGIPQIWRLIEPVPGAEARLYKFLSEIIVWQPEAEAEQEAPQQ